MADEVVAIGDGLELGVVLAMAVLVVGEDRDADAIVSTELAGVIDDDAADELP